MIQQLAAMIEEVLYMIFLDIHKEHDALDRDRCLDILEGYGVGPRSCRILREYWDRLQMVACAGIYCGEDFKLLRGVTQEDPFPPTIFNMVVEAVVRHWSSLIEERLGG